MKSEPGSEGFNQKIMLEFEVRSLVKECIRPANEKEEVNAVVKLVIARLKKLKGNGKERKLHDFGWLKEWGIKYPLSTLEKCTSESRLTFNAPTEVCVVGSGSYDKRTTVDLALLIPDSCFAARDYLNHIYHRKKALYLSYIAHFLTKKTINGVTAVKFCRVFEESLNSIALLLHFEGLNLDLRLLAHASQTVFPLKRFMPNVNNLRIAGDANACATPHYNAQLLVDLLLPNTSQFVANAMNGNPWLVSLNVLFNNWLLRRQLSHGRGCFSPFLASYVLCQLYSVGVLSEHTPWRDSFRDVLQYMVENDWSIAKDDLQFYEVVFMDQSSTLNLAANLSLPTYRRVIVEAERSILLLETPTGASFDDLFLRDTPFAFSFDHTFTIRTAGRLEQYVRGLEGGPHKVVDLCAYYPAVVIPHVFRLIISTLGSRITLIDVQRSRSICIWELEEECPGWNNEITVGLCWDANTAFQALERGPSAELAQGCSEFRKLWGDLAQLRKFSDGSMCEAVVWNDVPGCLIPIHIINHMMRQHFNVPEAQIHHFGHDGDKIADGMTGMESSECKRLLGLLKSAYDKLCAGIRRVEDLPLSVSSLHPLSPALRGSQISANKPFGGYKDATTLHRKEQGFSFFPHLQGRIVFPSFHAHRVQLKLEASGKWPDDIQALLRLKAAYLIELGKKMKWTHSISAEYGDFLVSGFVFRVEIIVPKEERLAKVETETGDIIDTQASLKHNFNATILPATSAYLQSVSDGCDCYWRVVRLSLCWVNSHMLSVQVPDILVELIVAHIFVHPYPNFVPTSSIVGFARFLQLLSTFDWVVQPLIVNFNNEISETDVCNVKREFILVRPTLPIMCICTPCDTRGYAFTRQGLSAVIVQRLASLAQQSINQLKSASQPASSSLIKRMFSMTKNVLNAEIHLKKSVFMSFREFDQEGEVYASYLPIIEFDPHKILIQQLTEAFGHMALFVYDGLKPLIIGVVFKPNACNSVNFCPKNVVSRKRKADQLMFDKDAFQEDVTILGKGIVSSIKFL